jgi:hypothetical protein
MTMIVHTEGAPAEQAKPAIEWPGAGSNRRPTAFQVSDDLSRPVQLVRNQGERFDARCRRTQANAAE